MLLFVFKYVNHIYIHISFFLSVQALKYVPDSEVVAVGASSLDKATKFSHQHNILNAYGSYTEVCTDSNVDIIYVGTLHPWHLEHALLAINNNKHLLVEKPATCNGKDTEYLIDEANKKGVFFLEGLWTRFFPAVETSRKIIEEGIIGDIVAVHADFGFNASDSEPYPTSPFYNIDSGGGGLLFLGPYPLVAAIMAFPGETPNSIKAIGTKDIPTGVDLSAGIVMEYKNKAIAVLTYNISGETPEETIYIGTKGRLRIKTPAHCPTSFELTFKLPGRGQVVTRDFHYPLEDDKEEVVHSGGFNYPNSQGFRYEAEAVTRCILQGKKECPQFLPLESSIMAKIMDEIRKQLDVRECKLPSSINVSTSFSSKDGLTTSNP